MATTPLYPFWKGFTVSHHEFLNARTLRLELAPDERILSVCSGCDHTCFLVHDVHRRRVREATRLICRVELDVTASLLR